MAYYIKKDKNKKKPQDQKDSGNIAPEMRPFFKILGCVIVVIIAIILWAVRG